jgi:GLPGLI family protein
MKKLLVTIMVILTKLVFGQNQYSEYVVKDSINGFVFKATGKLFVDKNKHSNFILSQYENLLKSDDNLFKGSNNHITGDKKICYDNKEYFSDYQSKTSKALLFENDCESKRLVIEKIKFPKWTISSTFLMIDGHSVLKAEAIINDRKWIVYYNPEIKALANPWFFYGIKGLIIKAFDEKNNIHSN